MQRNLAQAGGTVLANGCQIAACCTALEIICQDALQVARERTYGGVDDQINGKLKEELHRLRDGLLTHRCQTEQQVGGVSSCCDFIITPLSQRTATIESEMCDNLQGPKGLPHKIAEMTTAELRDEMHRCRQWL